MVKNMISAYGLNESCARSCYFINTNVDSDSSNMGVCLVYDVARLYYTITFSHKLHDNDLCYQSRYYLIICMRSSILSNCDSLPSADPLYGSSEGRWCDSWTFAMIYGGSNIPWKRNFSNGGSSPVSNEYETSRPTYAVHGCAFVHGGTFYIPCVGTSMGRVQYSSWLHKINLAPARPPRNGY